MTLTKVALLSTPHFMCLLILFVLPLTLGYAASIHVVSVFGLPYLAGVAFGRQLRPRWLLLIVLLATILTLVEYYVMHIHRLVFRNPTFETCFVIVLVLGFFVYAPSLGITASALTGYLARQAQAGPGRCGNCGYNLTGNVSGVCPECGQVAQ